MRLARWMFFTLCFQAFVLSGVFSVSITEAMAVGLRNTCPNPPGTVQNKLGSRTFTLKHGQKGGCSVDKGPRHSAPYWERAEIATRDIRKGKAYRFSVDVNFDPSTKSSDRTTFFQIHQHKRGSCSKCYPAVMLKTNSSGSVTASIMNRTFSHIDKRLGMSRSQIAGKWTTFTIEMGTKDGMNPLVIYANGRALYSGTVYIEPKGAIYMKSGLYRPGSTTRKLPTDRVSIRKLRLETVK